MNDLGLQLKGNISELTAIAPIKPGQYPVKRLLIERNKQKDLLDNKKIKLWLSEKKPGSQTSWLTYLLEQGDDPSMTWIEHFRAVLDWAQTSRQEAIRKMLTIHYARWVILEQNRLPGIDTPHVLFTSNFDGTLDGYLKDFAAVDEGPLNLIFGHCVGWPGARPADRFIDYVRKHQHPASVFYGNYPRAKVGQVNRALEWKGKTEQFIEDIMPSLKRQSSASWKKIIVSYLNDLATPTAKEKEVQLP